MIVRIKILAVTVSVLVNTTTIMVRIMTVTCYVMVIITNVISTFPAVVILLHTVRNKILLVTVSVIVNITFCKFFVEKNENEQKRGRRLANYNGNNFDLNFFGNAKSYYQFNCSSNDN